MYKKLAACIVFLFFSYLFLSPSVFASSIQLQGNKTNLQSVDEEFPVTVTLSINTADNTNYYLRGVFYKPGTTKYCGFTWNGNTWFNGPYSSNEGWKNFLPITITNNSWSGELKAKIDPQDSGCSDTGTYNFKIERFTQNSSSGTFDSQNEQTVTVVIPTQTPTPLLTPTPTKVLATDTPVPTIKPTVTPKATATTKPAPTITPSKELAASSASTSPTQAVLAESTQSGKIDATPTTTTLGQKIEVKKSFLPIVFISAGCMLLLSCGILGFRQFRKKTNGDV